ncbi:S-adenosyl-L-methionine-dependent methyltransferase [Aspergillus pseudoustus]|uniref:S-adenosyl-L-methionine-dependent methyltransferase n=1 Tax=Aspergillus pseudoustus TaxID=1810923 RepID=A0ABR4KID3_9EURO
MGEAIERYPLGRDTAESKRLNEQHKLLIDILDGAIDSFIPVNRISSVADVATGTGVWLWDAQKALSENAGGSKRYFHGFDISSAQFPVAPHGIELSVHDVLTPFPPEHHDRYDLVHVRLLVTALGESEFETAARNLLSILRKGGYLQWVEIDYTPIYDPNNSHHPRAMPMIQSWTKYMDRNNISRNAPSVVAKAFEAAGLANVINRPFLVRGREDIKARAQAWELGFWSTVMPLVLQRTGDATDVDSANVKANQIIANLAAAFAEGEVIDVRFGTVIGQKAE